MHTKCSLHTTKAQDSSLSCMLSKCSFQLEHVSLWCLSSSVMLHCKTTSSSQQSCPGSGATHTAELIVQLCQSSALCDSQIAHHSKLQPGCMSNGQAQMSAIQRVARQTQCWQRRLCQDDFASSVIIQHFCKTQRSWRNVPSSGIPATWKKVCRGFLTTAAPVCPAAPTGPSAGLSKTASLAMPVVSYSRSALGLQACMASARQSLADVCKIAALTELTLPIFFESCPCPQSQHCAHGWYVKRAP